MTEEEFAQYWNDLRSGKIKGEPPKYLYHGTDAKIVRLSAEDRKEYVALCQKVADEAFAFIDGFGIEKASNALKDGELESWVKEAHGNMQAQTQGHGWYQYGDFYLAKPLLNACIYAMHAFAGGELARNAYRLAKGAEALGHDIAGANTIISFAEKKKEPVVFAFLTERLNLDAIRNIGGGPVNWLVDGLFRYMDPVTLDLEKYGIFLPENMEELDPFGPELAQVFDGAPVI